MAAEALLSSVLGLLLLGLLLPASLTGGVGSLNLEELSEMRYGIEILPLPVMGGQVRRVEGPRVWDRRGRGKGRGRKAAVEAVAGALGESGSVGGDFTTTPEDRRLRPIPLGPGTGRGGAYLCRLQVPVPDRSTQTPPPWRSGSALSLHPPNTAGGPVAHSVLTGLFPRI